MLSLAEKVRGTKFAIGTDLVSDNQCLGRTGEEIYANNPDQPASSRPAESAHAKSALMHGSDAHRHGAGRPKTIPALLMKRRTPEPENA